MSVANRIDRESSERFQTRCKCVNDEFFNLSDWLQHDSAGAASGAGTSRTNDTGFNDALARLVNAAFEAGAPPQYLRAMLAIDRWLPIPLPEPGVCAAAAARTRAFAVSADGSSAASSKKKRHSMPAVAANADNSVAYRIVTGDTAAASGDDAIDARQVLGQLPESTRFVVLQYADEYYSFNRVQCQALQAHYRQIADKRVAAQREQRDLLLLSGAGTLDEFLGMHVRVDKALKARCTGDGDVLMLQTLGYNNNRSDTVDMPLGELVQAIATRQDFHGVRFNRLYSDKAAFEFGPNFAAWCLRGHDPRHAGPCPAQAIRDIEFGMYLTRRFARVDAQRKAMIEPRLAHARALLAAIEPGQAALPRSAVISLEGAFALRRYPQVGQRQWLVDFIARAERALKTRWRIGVF